MIITGLQMNYPLEHIEQITFVTEFEKRYPDVRILAVPNGGYRHKAVAQKMKAEGLRPGVPDLFIPAWLTWVEMKRQKGGRLSPEQKDWKEYLEAIGHTVIVAKGWEDGMRQIREIRKC